MDMWIHVGTLRSLEVSGRQLRLCTRLHVARNGGRGLYREESRRVCRVDFDPKILLATDVWKL